MWISSGVLSALKSVLIVSTPKIVHLNVLFLSLFLLWLGAASVGALVLIPLANIWKIPMRFLNNIMRDLYRTTKWFDFFFFPPVSLVGLFCTIMLILSWISFMHSFASLCSQPPDVLCLCALCSTEDMRQWLLSSHHIPEAVLGRQQQPSLGLSYSWRHWCWIFCFIVFSHLS